MRCLIDTNVLFSAALFPGGRCDQAFIKACTAPEKAYVCDYSLEELKLVFTRKFPNKLKALEIFIERAIPGIQVLKVDDTMKRPDIAALIRDPKDAPILLAAFDGDIDVIISGDKDFTVLDLERPKTATPADYLENY